VPLRLLLAAAGVAILAACAWRASAPWRHSFSVAATLVVLSPLPFIGLTLVEPWKGQEVADGHGVYQLLQEIPTSGTLLIASDIADPANDYERSARGFLLTGYGGHQFYLANLAYLQFRWPDAVQRLENLQAFFGTPWSPWHEELLRTSGITHVLVDDRCPAAWQNSPTPGLRLMARAGHWAAYTVYGPLAGTGPRPAAVPVRRRYGTAACLAWSDALDRRSSTPDSP
jgi:hypothetical protein